MPHRLAYRHAVLHQAGYELCGTAGVRCPGLFRWPRRPAEPAAGVRRAGGAALDAVLRARFPGAAADIARARLVDAAPPGVRLHPRRAAERRGDLPSLDRRADRRAGAGRCARSPTRTPSATSSWSWCPRLTTPAKRAGGADGDPGTPTSSCSTCSASSSTSTRCPTGPRPTGALGDGDLPEQAPARAPAATDEEIGRTGGRRPTTVAATRRSPPAGSWLYDEWDHHGQRYLTAWCRVNERPLAAATPGSSSDVRRRHAALTRQVRHQFARITPQTWRRMRREPDGAELDLDEVIKAMVDRRAGLVDDEHLHIRQVRGTREVAAVFLLDMSSSTVDAGVADPSPAASRTAEPDTILYRGSPWDEDEPPPPTGPTVLDVAKESLAVICDALQIARRRARDLRLQRRGARRRRALRRQGLRRGAVGAHVGPAGGDAAALVHPHGPGDPSRHRPAQAGGGTHPVPRRRLRRLPAGPRLRPESRRRDLWRGRHGQGAGGGRTPRHRHVLHHRRPCRARLPGGSCARASATS